MRRALLAAAGGSSAFVNPWISIDRLLTMLAGGVTKDAGNPVLPKGTAGQWDDWGVRELSPVIDENGLVVTEADGIWGYYAGFPDGTGTDPWKIGLAKSTDLGATWTRYGSNPVASPAGTGWYQNDVSQPSVVKRNDGTWVMLATGRNSGDVDSIGCLSSTDGLAWIDEGVKLGLGDFLDGATAITELGVPSMIHRSAGDWLVIVEGLKSGVTNGWRVWGATAPDPTGTWTVLNSGQPLLSPTGSGFESVGVANMHLIENSPGHYAAIYNGISTPAPEWKVGFAYGSTLTALTRYASNPILAKGAGGQWDDLQTEATFLLKEPWNNALRFLYQGFDDPTGSMQVGLATAA